MHILLIDLTHFCRLLFYFHLAWAQFQLKEAMRNRTFHTNPRQLQDMFF